MHTADDVAVAWLGSQWKKLEEECLKCYDDDDDYNDVDGDDNLKKSS